jgi:hypothetical protein
MVLLVKNALLDGSMKELLVAKVSDFSVGLHRLPKVQISSVFNQKWPQISFLDVHGALQEIRRP